MKREIFLLVALMTPARLAAEPGPLFPEALAVAVVLPAPYDPGLAQLYSMIPPNAMEPPRLPGLPSAASSGAGRLPLIESSVIALNRIPRPAPPVSVAPVPVPPAPVPLPVVTPSRPTPPPAAVAVPTPAPVPPPPDSYPGSSYPSYAPR